MDTFWALYFFVKLDDIKDLLSGYGFTVILCAVVICLLPASPYIYDFWDEKKDLFIKYAKRWGVCVLLIFVLESFLTVAATALPSTGQMAAIYLGSKAVESETADVLARLPAKYATLLESKADEWLSAQLPKPPEAE